MQESGFGKPKNRDSPIALLPNGMYNNGVPLPSTSRYDWSGCGWWKYPKVKITKR
jgi:hypothetical protein